MEGRQSRAAALVHIIGGINGVWRASVSPVPPSAKFPYVRVREIHGKEIETLGGPSDLLKTIFQIEVWDSDYERGWQFREYIKDYMLKQVGGPIGQTGQNIGGVNHDHDAELHDDKRELHQLITRLFIHWSDEGIPNYVIPTSIRLQNVFNEVVNFVGSVGTLAFDLHPGTLRLYRNGLLINNYVIDGNEITLDIEAGGGEYFIAEYIKEVS